MEIWGETTPKAINGNESEEHETIKIVKQCTYEVLTKERMLKML